MDEPGIAVVGGGIAGASIAFHLGGETDRPVTVYERGEIAGETTAKSAAFFGFYGSAVERRMKREGMARYNGFFADPRGEPYYDLVGRLGVATTEEGAERLASAAREERRGGQPVRSLEAAEIRRSLLLPELDPDPVTGAHHRPGVGYVDPRAIAREFVARARERGARFETGAAVSDVLVEAGRATGIVVDGERIPTAAVVCAAGPWNPIVAGTVGVKLPVAHSLAPILVLDPGRSLGHTLPIVSHAETGVYVRGHRDGTILLGRTPTGEVSGRLDPADVGDRVPDDVREELRAVLAELLPPLADARVVDEWVGVRSHTPDGHPIAGWTGVEGFSVAAFDSSGIQLAPAVGRVIARQLVRGDPTDYRDDLTLSRFDGFEEAPTSL